MDNKYSSPLYKAYAKVITSIANVHFNKIRSFFNHGKYYDLTDSDLSYIKSLLSKNYYIILTRRKSHLSTYLIQVAGLIKTGEASMWAHALMNLEGDNPVDDTDFRLMEATGTGVHYSNFMQVFDCDWVALLKPKHITLSDWTDAFDKILTEAGKPYDDLFDLADDTHLSCVELVRDSLKSIPDYDVKFKSFEDLIKKEGNLTPQMYYDCSDCFEVAFEIRR